MLVDHLVAGSKESRIADEVRRSPVGQHVLVVGHPYVDVWADQLRRVHPGLSIARARAMAHIAFGLINSTPHSGLLVDEEMHGLLRDMALGALLTPH